jgi:hypothetical protein
VAHGMRWVGLTLLVSGPLWCSTSKAAGRGVGADVDRDGC